MLASDDVHGLKLLDHLQNRWTTDLPGTTHRSSLNTGNEYSEVDKQMPGTHICSLKALGSVFEIYKLLTGTSVALRVIGRTLGTSNWAKKAAEKDMRNPRSHQDSFQAFEPDRPSTFSCIAMFETGNLDLDPSLLAQVMALASRNAIYTSPSLLCDPSDDIRGYEIKCLVGNVGRAGIALMIPPTEPRILKDDIGHYKVINHQPYDGQNRNSLGGSSLHLSFTGYEQTVVEALSHHGAQVSEVFFLESLISAYDRTKWIADLDVLASFDDGSLARAPLPSNQCMHDPKNLPIFPTASIDSWEELIDRPSEAGVVRCFGSPFARLAAMSISVQKRYPTVILPERTCWLCLPDILQRDVSSCIFIQ